MRRLSVVVHVPMKREGLFVLVSFYTFYFLLSFFGLSLEF